MCRTAESQGALQASMECILHNMIYKINTVFSLLPSSCSFLRWFFSWLHKENFWCWENVWLIYSWHLSNLCISIAVKIPDAHLKTILNAIAAPNIFKSFSVSQFCFFVLFKHKCSVAMWYSFFLFFFFLCYSEVDITRVLERYVLLINFWFWITHRFPDTHRYSSAVGICAPWYL